MQTKNGRIARLRRLTALVEAPGDGDHTLGLGGDGSESTDGEIDRVATLTSWANIGDGCGCGLSVVGVGDGDRLATVWRVVVGSVILPETVGVDGDNVVRVGVNGTTCTGVTTLQEVGGVTRV